MFQNSGIQTGIPCITSLMNINILDVVRWSGEECGLDMLSVDSGHQGVWSVTLVGGDSLGVTRNCSIMINVASPSQVS